MYAIEAGATPRALKWILTAASLIGKPYPPLDSKGKIIETPGAYHCAKVILTVLQNNLNAYYGRSCKKQREHILENPEQWLYVCSPFDLEDLQPGDFIY